MCISTVTTAQPTGYFYGYYLFFYFLLFVPLFFFACHVTQHNRVSLHFTPLF